jgi:hypothetical protein
MSNSTLNSNVVPLSVFKPLEGKEFREIFDMCRDEYNMTVKYTQDLYLIKYMRDRGADPTNEFVRNCRGVIFEKDVNPPNPVCYPITGGIPYKTFKNRVPIEHVYVEESIDGTMINVFYYKDEWRVSTKGCIDAKRSRWGSSKSFYTMFNEACNFDLQELNQNYCYTFVLVHSDNRIVTKYKHSDLYLVHVRNMTTMQSLLRDHEYQTNFTRPNTLTFSSYEELEESLATLPYNKEGFMLFDNRNPDVRVKCKGTAYIHVKNMKGNDRNKRYGLLKKMLQNTEVDYLRMFPEDYEIVKELNVELNNLIKSISYYYKNVHVYKTKMDIPKHLAPILYNLHGQYLEKVNKNKEYRTSHGVIQRYIYNLDTALVYYLLGQEKRPHNLEDSNTTDTTDNTTDNVK